MEFHDPLVLELVPDGEHVRPVLVQKCLPGRPTSAESLNQRGHETWPEITCWPKHSHFGLSGGKYFMVQSTHHNWSSRFYNQELHIMLLECRDGVIRALAELDEAKPLERTSSWGNPLMPHPDDFGERWYRELKELNRQKRITMVEAEEGFTKSRGSEYMRKIVKDKKQIKRRKAVIAFGDRETSVSCLWEPTGHWRHCRMSQGSTMSFLSMQNNPTSTVFKDILSENSGRRRTTYDYD